MHGLRALVMLAAAAVWPAGAAERWHEFRTGPFEVFSTEEKQGRETLNELEQFRHVFGTLIGKPEARTIWPVRVIVHKQGRGTVSPELKVARDAYVAAVVRVLPETRRTLAAALLEANAGRLPDNIERGLLDLFAGFEAEGTIIRVGARVPSPTRDWSRMQMLIVDPRFSGKLRVLLYNLQQGVDPEPAYRNAFGMSPDEVERELDKYIEANRFEAGSLSGKALSARRQLMPRDADPAKVELTLLDIKAVNGERSAEAMYEQYPGALDAPVPVLRRARAEKDEFKARALYDQAAKLNPLWGEPWWYQAQMETNPLRKVALLKKAAELAPRSSEWWVALARAQEAAGQFQDATKSWGVAERATGTASEKEQIRQARLAGEEQRREQVRLEKEEEARKAQAEVEALRQRALAEIRAAEARANSGRAPRDPNEKLEMYRENMGYEKVAGRLQRVDCRGRDAILHIASASGLVKLHVPDPGKLAVEGGDRSLGCGVQKPAPEVTAEYGVKANPRTGTAGEAITVQFR